MVIGPPVLDEIRHLLHQFWTSAVPYATAYATQTVIATPFILTAEFGIHIEPAEIYLALQIRVLFHSKIGKVFLAPEKMLLKETRILKTTSLFRKWHFF